MHKPNLVGSLDPWESHVDQRLYEDGRPLFFFAEDLLDGNNTTKERKKEKKRKEKKKARTSQEQETTKIKMTYAKTPAKPHSHQIGFVFFSL